MVNAGGADLREHRGGLCTLGGFLSLRGTPALRRASQISVPQWDPHPTASAGLGTPEEDREPRAGGGQRVRIPPGPGGRLTGRKRPGVAAADWQSPAPMERRRQPRRLRTACAAGPSQPGAGAPLPAPLPLPLRLPLR